MSVKEVIYNSDGSVSTKAVTMEETDKKCPCCGGIMDFDPSTGTLHCPYCDHLQEIEALDKKNSAAEELDFNAADKKENCDWGKETKTVICKSCGGEMVYDALQTAGECPYCGSNQVMETHDENTLAPGGVCVFKVDKETAGQNFYKWIKKKIFCPSKAKKNAKPEAFKGVYLPYWTFDTNTTSVYTAKYGKDRTVGKGDEQKTVTDWYNTSGTYIEFINDQLVAASTQQDSAILKKVEPFDTADNFKYKPEYIAGFASERYSIGLKDGWEKAKEFIRSRIRRNIEDKITDEHNADHVKDLKFTTSFSKVTYKYLLLPIWVSSFSYNGKVYQFMVNGQTGKVGGKTPVSPLRVVIAVLIGIAAFVLIRYLTGSFN